MANQKLQPERAIPVVPNTTIDIPSPAHAITFNDVTSLSTGKLIDSAASFESLGIEADDIVVSYGGTPAITRVASVDSDTQLTLDTDIFTIIGEDYTIYKNIPSPALLYVGGAGDIAVQTSGDDAVTFKNIPAGTFIPVHVVRVKTATATDIIALR